MTPVDGDHLYRSAPRRTPDRDVSLPVPRPSAGTGRVPLTCLCRIPIVGRNDECVRCFRVIAEQVWQRRIDRALAERERTA